MPATVSSPAPLPALRLDLRGLKCPLPALHARKALDHTAPGVLLSIECTDPMAAIDLPNLARETGDLYEGKTEGPEFTAYHIRRAERP